MKTILYIVFSLLLCPLWIVGFVASLARSIFMAGWIVADDFVMERF